MDWQQEPEAETNDNAETVDYMGKKSKGKGKGRNGGKGKGKSSKGKGKGEETRSCHWCLKTRHRIAECRSKAAGKPKAPRPLGASSIEPEEWKEDCSSLTFDCDVMGEESDEDQISDEEDGWMEASNIPISTPSSTKNSAIDPWMQAMQNSKKDEGILYWDMTKSSRSPWPISLKRNNTKSTRSWTR